jgi:hypothetical protein
MLQKALHSKCPLRNATVYLVRDAKPKSRESAESLERHWGPGPSPRLLQTCKLLSIRRENGIFRSPVNLKARRLKTARDVGADRRLPFEHRLTGKDDNGIIAPIGYDLIDVLAGRSEIGPLCQWQVGA